MLTDNHRSQFNSNTNTTPISQFSWPLQLPNHYSEAKYQLNLRRTPNSGSQPKDTLALPKPNSKANCHFQVTVQISATSPGNALPLFDHNWKAHCYFHITRYRVGPIPGLQFKVWVPLSYEQSATHCHSQIKYQRPTSTLMLPLRIASICVSQFQKPTAHSH